MCSSGVLEDQNWESVYFLCWFNSSVVLLFQNCVEELSSPRKTQWYSFEDKVLFDRVVWQGSILNID